jgi:hypothetical protein
MEKPGIESGGGKLSDCQAKGCWQADNVKVHNFMSNA